MLVSVWMFAERWKEWNMGISNLLQVNRWMNISCECTSKCFAKSFSWWYWLFCWFINFFYTKTKDFGGKKLTFTTLNASLQSVQISMASICPVKSTIFTAGSHDYWKRKHRRESLCRHQMVWMIIQQRENGYEILDEDKRDKGCELLMNWYIFASL